MHPLLDYGDRYFDDSGWLLKRGPYTSVERALTEAPTPSVGPVFMQLTQYPGEKEPRVYVMASEADWLRA